MSDNSSISDVLAGADQAIDARASTAIAAALAPAQIPVAPPYSTHTTTMLRQLDEQRQHFVEVADEYAAEIAVLTAKRDDAVHAAAMAEAGMRSLEG